MSLRSFISKIFKRKSSTVPSPTEAAKPDYSLRPNPDTYLDQSGESTAILNRIRSSSSSVIGIAGVRGAGKSSLAFKILNSCDRSGYFTLLIHSPTGYEPREFLLSVFQRICEATIARLERLFGQEQTVEGRGHAQLRRSRLTARLLLVGAFAVLVVPIGYAFYRYINIEKARSESRRQAFESRRQQFATDLQRELANVTRSQNLLENCIKSPENCKSLNKEILTLNESRKELLTDWLDGNLTQVRLLESARAIARRYPHLEPSKELRISEEDIRYIVPRAQPTQLISLSEYLRDSVNRMRVLEVSQDREDGLSVFESSSSVYLWQLLPLLAIALVGYVGAIGIGFAVRKVRRRIVLQKKYPRETGLYQLAKETLEHLKYQTTVTSSQDASVSLWKLASKFVRTKQLETRPVSMPGLTADCNTFINNVADVFGGKSVICLDELDKIIDPTQLEELLTGVKGILGQNRSHFVLTVSEDALARFATRRRAERDIVESSFDEIISLNRVNFPVAQYIVSKMLAVSDQDIASARLNKNILVAWIFGSGIPRELKRNVVMAADRFDFVNGDPKELWRILFTALVESLQSWALIASAEKDIAYDFLFCLESVKALRDASVVTEDPTGWFRELVALWSNHYQLPFVQPTAEGQTLAGADDDETASFERGIFELIIGAYALLLVADEDATLESIPTDRLLDVFTLLAYSPSFAGFKFRSLLTDSGIFDLAK